VAEVDSDSFYPNIHRGVEPPWLREDPVPESAPRRTRGELGK
jgi:hypothetical protein